ncbi:hypothetical protein GWK36_11130 [Caldichromatium japonicum]|uniref:Uncharacterized protein n=1 Tax=Caldichromatium japonicum TaxID=2699430 RepID=A0A6G7VEG9_9GAMM|nr:hypothetical protein [Caldichromatium japonicum]QIK38439.1 hypothetical protein GWK36_11130 [Caldichromatium japonicum]
MVKLLLAPLVVFAVLAGWVWIESLYARFQARYPQLGPFRNPEGGCACCRQSPAGGCPQPNAGEPAPLAHAVAKAGIGPQSPEQAHRLGGVSLTGMN